MRTLYLEERIAWVRKALNGQTLQFKYALPPEMRLDFQRLVMACIAVLDGEEKS